MAAFGRFRKNHSLPIAAVAGPISLGRRKVCRDFIQDYSIRQLGPSGTCIFDDTGFLKKGNKSAGVQRQYTGTAGRVENCQIGVFAAWRTPHGHTLIDRESYLPLSWMKDEKRCEEAGIPKKKKFQTKQQLALLM